MTDEDRPVEDIPDTDVVYYRIHRSLLVDGGIRGNCFREQGATEDLARPRSISTDWSRYSSPKESRARAGRPLDNLIVSLAVGALRAIDELTVAHSPVAGNRAHTDAFGVGRDPEIRDRPREMAEILLPL